MANITISCPECKTKNKIPKNKAVFNCKKCSYTIFNNQKTKERFKLLKKITGTSDNNSAKKREENKIVIRSGVENLYSSINEDLGKGKLKDVESKLIQLFQIDNTFFNKYLCLLLLKLKVSNTVDAYDAFRKQNKKNRTLLMNSNFFQILHLSLLYRPFIDDLILHTYFKKIKKNDRMNLTIIRNS